MQNSKGSRHAIVAASVFTIAIAGACYGSAEAPTTSTSISSDIRSADRLTLSQAQRLRSARAQTRWVGDAHHEAMKVVITHIAASKQAKRLLPSQGSASYCALLEQVGLVALRELARNSANISKSDHRARIRATLATECPSQPSSVAPAPTPFRSASWTQAEDTEVTGAYEGYLPAMEEAVLGSDGSVFNVRNRLEAVLVGAVLANIAESDLLALSSFAGLIESSAEEWNAFDWSAYEGGDCAFAKECPVAMSPHALGFGKKVLGVVAADAMGCLSTVKSWSALKLLLGTAVPSALAGECGVRGALASGGAVIAMLK
jgi:hypothetical protein